MNAQERHEAEAELRFLRAQAGDRTAQGELLAWLWPSLVRRVRSSVERVSGGALRHEQDDLQQDAAVRLLRALPRADWRGERAFRCWALRQATGAVWDRQRHVLAARRDARETEGEASLPVAARTPTPERHGANRQRLAEVVWALSRLRPDYARAILFRALGGEHGELAAELGITTEAARKLHARGLRQLLNLGA